jgi:hypothetical protein
MASTEIGRDSTPKEDDHKMSTQHLENVEAAVIQEDVSDLGIWKTITSHPVIILCCIYSNMGALMYGFDNIALSLVLNMVPFQFVQSFHPQIELSQAKIINLEHNLAKQLVEDHISFLHIGSLYGTPWLRYAQALVLGQLARFQIASVVVSHSLFRVLSRSLEWQLFILLLLLEPILAERW